MTPRRVVVLLSCALALAGPMAAATVATEGECDAADGSCDAAEASAPEDGKRRTRRTECEDKETECKFWASGGECEKNPNYMLGE